MVKNGSHDSSFEVPRDEKEGMIMFIVYEWRREKRNLFRSDCGPILDARSSEALLSKGRKWLRMGEEGYLYQKKGLLGKCIS